MKASEFLNVASSICSITGVSLVWLQANTKSMSLMEIATKGCAVAIATLFSIGVVVAVLHSLGWMLGRTSGVVRWYVWTLGLGCLLLASCSVLIFGWTILVKELLAVRFA